MTILFKKKWPEHSTEAITSQCCIFFTITEKERQCNANVQKILCIVLMYLSDINEDHPGPSHNKI